MEGHNCTVGWSCRDRLQCMVVGREGTEDMKTEDMKTSRRPRCAGGTEDHTRGYRVQTQTGRTQTQGVSMN